MLVFLNACASNPPEDVDAPESAPLPGVSKTIPPANESVHSSSPTDEPDATLISMLGMQRDITELGFAEKLYNPCDYHADAERDCGVRYVTVVHFQLLCRETEGTAQNVPVQILPISSPRVTWQIAARAGTAPTDANGYGHFVLSGPNPMAGQRLILHIGPQFVGLDLSEVTKVVLPNNYCHAD